MSHHNVNSSYEDTFYIVPRYIRKLPGITLAFLDVYEIIHQFWNKGLTCFLSNSTISQRCGIEIRQVQYALDFFEKSGELKRVFKGSKRYLVRPERLIEHDSSENIQPCTTVHPPMQSSASPPCTPVHPEYKEDINKEINTTTSNSINFEKYKEQEKENALRINHEYSRKEKEDKFREESLADEKCNQVYKERFLNLDVSLHDLYQECVDYWSQTNQMVYKARFLTHLKRCPIDKYKKIDSSNDSNSSGLDAHDQRMRRYALEREKQRGKYTFGGKSSNKAPIKLSELLK